MFPTAQDLTAKGLAMTERSFEAELLGPRSNPFDQQSPQLENAVRAPESLCLQTSSTAVGTVCKNPLEGKNCSRVLAFEVKLE